MSKKKVKINAKELILPGIALILSLATGISFAGGIVAIANILRPSLLFIPSMAYAFIKWTLFCASMVTWGTLHYHGLKSILKGKTPKQRMVEALRPHYELVKHTLKTNFPEFASGRTSSVGEETRYENRYMFQINYLIHHTKELREQEIKELTRQIKIAEKEEASLEKVSPIVRVLKPILSFLYLDRFTLSGISIRQDRSRKRQLERQLEALDTLRLEDLSQEEVDGVSAFRLHTDYDTQRLRSKDELTPKSYSLRGTLNGLQEGNVNKYETGTFLSRAWGSIETKIYMTDCREPYLDLLLQGLEFELPTRIKNSFSKMLKWFCFKILYWLTYIDALLISNSATLVFGGFTLISLLGLTNVFAINITLISFAILGTLNNLGGTVSLARHKIQYLLGFTGLAQQTLQQARQKSAKDGFFKLPRFVKVCLALLSSTTIAFGSYALSTALAEIVLNQSSILTLPQLFGYLSVHPFEASTYSIAWGILGGIATWVTVSAIFVGSAFGFRPNPHPNKSSPWFPQPSNTILLFLTSFASGLVLVAASALYRGKDLYLVILSHLSPIAIATLIITACYQSYLYCQDSTNSLVTNIVITATLLTDAFSAFFFSLSSGSLFHLCCNLWGIRIASGLSAIGKLELNLPTLNYTTGDLNNYFAPLFTKNGLKDHLLYARDLMLTGSYEVEEKEPGAANAA